MEGGQSCGQDAPQPGTCNPRVVLISAPLLDLATATLQVGLEAHHPGFVMMGLLSDLEGVYYDVQEENMYEDPAWVARARLQQ